MEIHPNYSQCSNTLRSRYTYGYRYRYGSWYRYRYGSWYPYKGGLGNSISTVRSTDTKAVSVSVQEGGGLGIGTIGPVQGSKFGSK